MLRFVEERCCRGVVRRKVAAFESPQSHVGAAGRARVAANSSMTKGETRLPVPR